MNIELLKKEVVQTLLAYIDASKNENLNWSYITNNNIHSGICAYASCNKLNYLKNCISNNNYFNDYIYTTPWNINYLLEKETYLNCHTIRVKYLTKILQEIIYIEQMKQEGKIYTYYTLISLFKF